MSGIISRIIELLTWERHIYKQETRNWRITDYSKMIKFQIKQTIWHNFERSDDFINDEVVRVEPQVEVTQVIDTVEMVEVVVRMIE